MDNNQDALDLGIKEAVGGRKHKKPGPCPDEETLACYLENRLGEKERERIEAHLAGCLDCCDEVIALNRITRAKVGTEPIPETSVKKAMDLMGRAHFEPIEPRTTGPTLPGGKGLGQAVAISGLSRRLVGFGAALALACALSIFVIPHLANLSFFGGSPSPLPLELRLEITGKLKPWSGGDGSPQLRSSLSQVREPSVEFEERPIKDGDVIRSGEGFRVEVETDQDAHVYVVLHHTNGRVRLLFPAPGASASGALEGGKRHTLPSTNQWFPLDEETGMETVFVLASREPIEAMPRLLQSLRDADAARVRETLARRADVVNAVTFRHVIPSPGR